MNKQTEHIEALLKEISPYPWEFVPNSWDIATVYVKDRQDIVCETRISEQADEDSQHEYEKTKDVNAEFIAAAPKIISSLLEQIKQKDEVIEAAKNIIYDDIDLDGDVEVDIDDYCKLMNALKVLEKR